MDVLEEIENIEDIEHRALKYFCYIARTQIFIDGNKRVAQLIANKVLIENDIGVFQISIEKLVTIHSPAENRGSVNSSTLCDAVAQNTDLGE